MRACEVSSASEWMSSRRWNPSAWSSCCTRRPWASRRSESAAGSVRGGSGGGADVRCRRAGRARPASRESRNVRSLSRSARRIERAASTDARTVRIGGDARGAGTVRTDRVAGKIRASTTIRTSCRLGAGESAATVRAESIRFLRKRRVVFLGTRRPAEAAELSCCMHSSRKRDEGGCRRTGEVRASRRRGQR